MHTALLYKNLRQQLNKAEYIYTVAFPSQGGPKELSWSLMHWCLTFRIREEPTTLESQRIASRLPRAHKITPSRLRLLPPDYLFKSIVHAVPEAGYINQYLHQQPSAVLHARSLGFLVSRSVGEDGFFYILPKYADEGNYDQIGLQTQSVMCLYLV
jgi:hypothetical protein